MQYDIWCWMSVISIWTYQLLNPDHMFEAGPIIQQPLVDVILHAGETAVFTCKICGRPRPNVTWKSPDSSVISPGPRVTLTHTDDGVFSLHVSRPNDTILQCVYLFISLFDWCFMLYSWPFHEYCMPMAYSFLIRLLSLVSVQKMLQKFSERLQSSKPTRSMHNFFYTLELSWF